MPLKSISATISSWITTFITSLLLVFPLEVWAEPLTVGNAILPTATRFAAVRHPGSRNIPQTDSQVLEPGKLIERELGGGQAHSYQLTLSAGQFLIVVVYQRGVDVAATLFGPDGNKLTEVNSPNGAHVPEPILIIVETTGNYRLAVRSLEKNAAVGRYEVKIDELRAATAQDKERIAAYNLFIEGDVLRSQQTKEALNKAVEKFQQALSLWRAANDKGGEADTYARLGSIYTNLGETKKGLEYSLAALPLRRTLGIPNQEAIALNDIGVRYYALGDYQRAGEYFAQALALYRKAGNGRGEATSLSNLGAVDSNLGERQRAIDRLQQALSLRRNLKDRAGEASTLALIADLYDMLGNYQNALDHQNQALLIHKEMGNRRQEAIAMASLATHYARLGESQIALDLWQKSLPLMKAVGNRSGESSILLSMGGLYNKLKEHHKALDSSEKALKLSREVNDRRNEADALESLGGAYKNMGEFEKARSHMEQALALHRASGASDEEASALRGIAELERDRDRLEESRARIEAAIKIVESLRSNVAIQSLRASYLGSKHQYYRLYIDVLMRLDQKHPMAGNDAAALQVNERARARSLLELLGEAFADLRASVNQELLMRDRELQQQLTVKTNQRLRLLNGPHTQEQVEAINKEIEELRGEVQQVEARIRSTHPAYAALTPPPSLSSVEIQQQVLDADSLLLEYSLGDQRSFLWAVTPTTLKHYELPRRAEVETAAKRVYELLTARSQSVEGESFKQRQARIAQADSQYGAAAAALSRMLLGPVAAELKTKRLVIVSDGALHYVPFAALPEPVIGGRWSVVGKKQNQPPATNHQPLIVKHEIVHLPSASTLAVLRRELAGRKLAPKIAAVLADPVFEAGDLRVLRNEAAGRKEGEEKNPADYGANFASSRTTRALTETGITKAGQPIPRLPWSQQEAAVIKALVPDSQRRLMLGFAANYKAATDPELGNYRIVHFATHGLLNSKQPELSGVLLSLVDEQGRPQANGILRLGEIYNLRLPAELVVLSACQTALGQQVSGEGLVGLTRGFMHAGAARVMASLWNVNDKATAELMQRFYTKMLGAQRLPPAAALRAAQMELWRNPKTRAPYYWGAFILQGEWK